MFKYIINFYDFQKMYFYAINRLTKRKFVDNMVTTIKRRKAYE